LAEYRWHPIEPLSDKDRAIDLGDIRHLYESWRAVRSRISKATPDVLGRFTERLVRSLSIETGILERLYDLDRGTTEALILHGFIEDLVARSSTNIEPSLLIDILKDQEAAIRLVMDCVGTNRALTKSVIHELHELLTLHQETTRAVDPFGKRLDIPLLKGTFKQHPNNPVRPDGSVHEYCPVIHVESEMDNLLQWLGTYSQEDPGIVTAWLHHRFTQIHPYQDGNGRVARALGTLVLLKAELLPLVVDRDLRVDYIHALESADGGDLTPLAMQFADLERRAILQALSVDVDAEVQRDRSITQAVIQSLDTKLRKRKIAKDQQLRGVNDLAARLRTHTRKWLEANLNNLKKAVAHLDEAEIHVTEGGPDRNNEHWYKFEVVESSKASQKWVNFEEAHYFLKATIRVKNIRLLFVVSLQHVGRELSGIMETTAFARLEFFEDEEDRQSVSDRFFQCSLESFLITWNTEENKILPSYDKWLDGSLAVAVKEWGDRL
jgi:Fic family protein